MGRIKNILKTYFAEGYFLLLTLSIFAPLLKPGYILSLDMVFSPNMNFPLTNAYGLYSETARDAMLYGLAHFIPAASIQKFILITIFFLGTYAIYRFLIHYTPSKKLYAIVAATFYMWNPFTYTRMLAGHWAFLTGYAIFPLFFYILIKFIKSKKISNSNLILTAGIWFFASLISLHFLGIYFIAAASYIVAYMLTYKKWEKIITRSVVLFLLITLMSLSWIAPSIIAGSISTVSDQHIYFFASSPDLTYGLSFNLISTYGFWAENSLGVMPKEILSGWWLIIMLLIIIAALPILKLLVNIILPKTTKPYKRELRRVFFGMILMSIAGLILAHGSVGFMQPVWDFFFNRFPVLQPFREAQKFLMLYIFAFAIGLHFGLILLQKYITQFQKLIQTTIPSYFIKLSLTFLSLTLVLIYTATMPFGLSQQLNTTNYPPSWYTLNAKLMQRQSIGVILVLPWQAYAPFPFANRQIADPSKSFFNGYVINERIPAFLTGEKICDVEFQEVFKEETKSMCINYDSPAQDWISQIKNNGINYVIINKTQGYETYDFTKDVEHFQLIIEDEFSLIYEVL